MNKDIEILSWGGVKEWYGRRSFLRSRIGLKIWIFGVSTCSEIPQKNQNFSPTKKIFFSSSKKNSHTFFTFFEKKIQHFFEIWKILGFSLYKKIEIFWTRIFEFKKIWFFYIGKIPIFFRAFLIRDQVYVGESRVLPPLKKNIATYPNKVLDNFAQI